MRRLLRGPAILILAVGCATAEGNAAKVRITSNQFAVKDCRFIGNVEGDEHGWGGTMGQGIAENNATVYMRNRANAMGADTILMVRSATNTSGSNQLGEAYDCSSKPSPPAAASPGPIATPRAGPKTDTKMTVVLTEEEVRGCVFVDSINEKIACPPSYSAGPACMAYRAREQGGNTLLAVGVGKVYSCPTESGPK